MCRLIILMILLAIGGCNEKAGKSDWQIFEAKVVSTIGSDAGKGQSRTIANDDKRELQFLTRNELDSGNEKIIIDYILNTRDGLNKDLVIQYYLEWLEKRKSLVSDSNKRVEVLKKLAESDSSGTQVLAADSIQSIYPELAKKVYLNHYAKNQAHCSIKDGNLLHLEKRLYVANGMADKLYQLYNIDLSREVNSPQDAYILLFFDEIKKNINPSLLDDFNKIKRVQTVSLFIEDEENLKNIDKEALARSINRFHGILRKNYEGGNNVKLSTQERAIYIKKFYVKEIKQKSVQKNIWMDEIEDK